MNTTVTGAAAAYLTAVRAELSDLPPGELEDVLEDVTDHLTEVAAELGEDTSAQALEDRLGTPRQYADELRNAAGYPPKGEPHLKTVDGATAALRWGILGSTVGPFFLVIGMFAGTAESFLICLVGLALSAGAAVLGLRALRDRDPRVVLETPRGRSAEVTVRGILEQLSPGQRRELRTVGQPVWWVARGLVIGGGIFSVFGAGAATVVAALAGAVFSVWVGRRTQEDRRLLWYVVPLNVVAAIVVPVWLVASFVGGTSFGGLDDGYHNQSDYSGSSGLSIDGQQITNIYPFDPTGRPVQVRLYDQSGQPINLPLQDCAANWGTNSTGPGVTNLFPQPVIVPDQDSYAEAENCQETDKPPFAAPPMPATPTAPTSSAQPTAGVPTSPGLTTPGATTSTGPSSGPSSVPNTRPGVTPTTAPTTAPAAPTTAPTASVPAPGVTLTVVPNR